MPSMTVILCGFLFVPGADPTDYTHDVHSGYTSQSGQMYDPYGVYTHLRQTPQPTPYHIVRHDSTRSPQVARTSPQMQTPPRSPYQLVQQPRPAPNPVAVVKQSAPSYPIRLIACAATVTATYHVDVVRADYRLPKVAKPTPEIQQADYRLPDTEGPVIEETGKKYHFPIPEWGWDRPAVESALDQRQSPKR